MDGEKLEAALRALADREAIRGLTDRYAHCVWTKDAAAIAALFVEDGVMDTGDGRPLKGRETITKVYQRVFARNEFQPFVHNHLITLAGDSASGTCYLDLRGTVDGKRMIGAGHYDDRYVRVDGEWKFLSRRLAMRFLVPLNEGSAQAGEP